MTLFILQQNSTKIQLKFRMTHHKNWYHWIFHKIDFASFASPRTHQSLNYPNNWINLFNNQILLNSIEIEVSSQWTLPTSSRTWRTRATSGRKTSVWLSPSSVAWRSPVCCTASSGSRGSGPTRNELCSTGSSPSGAGALSSTSSAFKPSKQSDTSTGLCRKRSAS